jgi:hypothetical protein
MGLLYLLIKLIREAILSSYLFSKFKQHHEKIIVLLATAAVLLNACSKEEQTMPIVGYWKGVRINTLTSILVNEAYVISANGTLEHYILPSNGDTATSTTKRI